MNFKDLVMKFSIIIKFSFFNMNNLKLFLL